MRRGVCSVCRAAQSSAWKVGQRCSECRGVVQAMRCCPWCRMWVASSAASAKKSVRPAKSSAAYCSECDLNLSAIEDDVVASYLAANGVDKLSLPRRCQELSKAEVKRIHDQFKKYDTSVKVVTAEIEFCESFLLGEGLAARFYDEQIAIYPHPNVALSKSRKRNLVGGTPEEILVRIAASGMSRQARSLATICLTRFHAVGSAMLEEAAENLISLPFFNAEVVAAAGRWNWPREEFSDDASLNIMEAAAKLIGHPVYGGWAALAYLAEAALHVYEADAKVIEAAKKVARRLQMSKDREQAFQAATVLQNPALLGKFASQKSESPMKQAARGILIGMGHPSAVKYLAEMDSEQQLQFLRRFPALRTVPVLKKMLQASVEPWDIFFAFTDSRFADYERSVRAYLSEWLRDEGYKVIPTKRVLELMSWSLMPGTHDKRVALESFVVCEAVTKCLNHQSDGLNLLLRSSRDFGMWVENSSQDDIIATLIPRLKDRVVAESVVQALAHLGQSNPRIATQMLLRLWDETESSGKPEFSQCIAKMWYGSGETVFEFFANRFLDNKDDRDSVKAILNIFGNWQEKITERPYSSVSESILTKAELFPDQFINKLNRLLWDLPHDQIGEAQKAVLKVASGKSARGNLELFNLFLKFLILGAHTSEERLIQFASEWESTGDLPLYYKREERRIPAEKLKSYLGTMHLHWKRLEDRLLEARNTGEFGRLPQDSDREMTPRIILRRFLAAKKAPTMDHGRLLQDLVTEKVTWSYQLMSACRAQLSMKFEQIASRGDVADAVKQITEHHQKKCNEMSELVEIYRANCEALQSNDRTLIQSRREINVLSASLQKKLNGLITEFSNNPTGWSLSKGSSLSFQ